MKIMRTMACAVIALALLNVGHAAELKMQKANNLDELLTLVEQARLHHSEENAAREREFREKRSEQQRLLDEEKAERRRQEKRSDQLETTFEENEVKIGNLEEALDRRLGSLRELFGVLQQVAGDMRGQFETSIVSAEYPNRGEWLSELAAKMGTSTQLATIAEMERLWFEVQREMTETGKVTRFPATIRRSNGDQEQTDVVRVGAFNLVADGLYMNYDSNAIVEIPQQPASRFANTAANVMEAQPGELVAFGIDPTRGSLLTLLAQAATLKDRVGTPLGGISNGECGLPFSDGQGGCMGAVIILVGIVGVLLAIERLITLSLIGMAVNRQKKQDEANTNNPLGRVIKVYEDNRDVDVETLDLKLSEAILGETPKLTRNITLIQVISTVAPLMGLLGTVIGMIITFQAITLFGTGDPKTMAGGISTALMTTVLGLVVAIPMVLLHAVVNTRSKSVIHVLEEQSAGIIAEHAERSGKAIG